MVDAAAAAATSAADVPTAAPAKVRTSVRDWSTAKLTRTLRMANMCNGAAAARPARAAAAGRGDGPAHDASLARPFPLRVAQASA
jgi:hypothetical protein